MICNRLYRPNLIGWSVRRRGTSKLLRRIGSRIVIRCVKIGVSLHNVLHELPRLRILQRESLRDRITSIDNRLCKLLPGRRERIQILLTGRKIAIRHGYGCSVTHDRLRLYSISSLKCGRLRHAKFKQLYILLIFGIDRFGRSLKADATRRKAGFCGVRLSAS